MSVALDGSGEAVVAGARAFLVARIAESQAKLKELDETVAGLRVAGDVPHDPANDAPHISVVWSFMLVDTLRSLKPWGYRS